MDFILVKMTKLEQKILIMGLDNSGKTCILLSLKDETNLLSYVSLKPTKGLDISNLENKERDLSIWDCGGQEQYRNDYLRSFEKYSTKLKKLIYVIDVQDRDRYELSLQYLKEIIDKLIEDKSELDVSIFLHKLDRNLIRQEKFKDIYEQVNADLIPKIKTIIPSEFKYKIFTTSINTFFEKTLVHE